MIQNEEELRVTKARIERFQKWLLDMRQQVDPEEFLLMSSSYRLEIERMQAEVLEYLLYPAIVASMQTTEMAGSSTV
ncbi:MAG: hypothetical protein R3C14_13200 [Caldilineaceae bacterium]